MSKAYILIDIDTMGAELKYGDEQAFSDCPHFTVEELACHDGSDVIMTSHRLIKSAEILRAECGNHICIVSSAFRTPSHNEKVGGAINSQHLYGKALDLVTPYGITTEKFGVVAGRVMGALSGVGVYEDKGFVHIDIREEHVRW